MSKPGTNTSHPALSNEELVLLLRLGEQLVSELDLEKVLALLAEAACHVIKAETLVVPIIDADGQTFTYRAANGKHAAIILGQTFPIHEGACGWVIQHQRPLLFGEGGIYELAAGAIWQPGMASNLLVPFICRGVIAGGLSAMGKQDGGAFNQHDLMVLTLFANQASIAFDNARLFQNLTEEKAIVSKLNAELEQRVAQRTAQLEASNKELEEFSYSMSHDMRTPLRALDGFSKILLEEYSDNLDDEGKRILRVLRDNSQRVGRLLDDILHYLSLERREMNFGPVDMAKLASGIFSELQPKFPASRMRLAIGPLPPAWGDGGMMREVLDNLLSNAIKFSPAGKDVVIEIGGVAVKDENVYSVTDCGIGFDMRFANKLFRVFERVHPTGQYEGSGIGLAIVKRIVIRHGGRVWAESKVNEGTTVYFALPVSNKSQPLSFTAGKSST
jgi:signal transduction histidine kinase